MEASCCPCSVVMSAIVSSDGAKGRERRSRLFELGGLGLVGVGVVGRRWLYNKTYTDKYSF